MDLDAAIFIDAIRSGDEPGTVRCYEREELFSVGPAQRTGPHDPALRDTLLSLEFNGRAPAQIYLVGVVPATVDYGIGLSEAVQQAIPNAVEQVCSTLRMLGHETRPRPEALPANRWWEDGASNPKASARR
jgi:hydrogenase maturation protease